LKRNPGNKEDAMLDQQDTITPLQSATVLNALKAMVPQVVAIVAVVTGKSLDVEVLQRIIDSGGLVCLSLWTIYYQCRTIRSRIDATQAIATKQKE
jgi:hypothetical protein